MPRIDLPYGQDVLTVDVPSGNLQGVVEGVGVVRPRARVYEQPVRTGGLADKPHHLPLVVRLPELEVHARELASPKVLYVVEGQGSVDLGSALAEGAEVHAVEDVDGGAGVSVQGWSL